MLYLYPGDRHLFTDSSLRSYAAVAAALVINSPEIFSPQCGDT
jgi:hypothetical protein